MNTWFYIQIASKLSYHLMFFFTLYKTWQYHKVAQEHIRPSEQDWKKEKNILEEQKAQKLRILSRSLADCKSLALNAVVFVVFVVIEVPSPARGQMPPPKGGKRSILSKCLRPDFNSNSGLVCLVITPPTPPHPQWARARRDDLILLRLQRERRLRIRRDDLDQLQRERRLRVRRDDLVQLRPQRELRLRIRRDDSNENAD